MTIEVISDERGRRARLFGGWLDEDVRALAAAETDWLEVMGFAGRDLEFLSGVAMIGIRQLDILTGSVADVSGIRFLPDLQRLNVAAYYRLPIDLRSHTSLTKLHLEWGPGAETVAACHSLRSLSLQKPTLRDLSILRELSCLEHLRLAGTRTLRSLHGVEPLALLRSIRLLDLRGLTDLAALQVCPNLEDVSLDGCSRIGSIEFIEATRNIRRLVLVDCGQIDSLRVVERLPGLEELIVSGTKPADGLAPNVEAMERLQSLTLRGTGLNPGTARGLEVAVASRSMTG